MRSSTRFCRCVSLAILAGCLGLRAALGATVISVTNTNDSGPGSLRDAITSAETSAPPITIQFAILPTNGTVQTILPGSSLPPIPSQVLIDGYSQPGASTNTLASGDNAVILIELNGAEATGDGLVITGGLATVRGLAIDRFSGNGVNCSAQGGDVIQGNFIGTDATGTNGFAGNNIGVTVGSGATNTIIGGTTPDTRNLISGNFGGGIAVQEQNVLIQGNFIGTDLTGTNALTASSGNGVLLFTQGILGGTNSAAGNIISGNGGYGVDVSGVSNVVEGNFIGIDVNGSNAVGNVLGGVEVAGPLNTIGGQATGAGNIISGNGADGVDIFTDSTTLVGNFIGTDVTGSRVVSNASDGILVNGDFNVIGPTNGVSPNVISGNANGVRIDAQSNVADLNVIQGSFIGTDVTGTHILSNSLSGVLITEGLGISASSNTVGGAAGNIIAGSGSNGVTVVGDGSTGNAILGNSILSNAANGVFLTTQGILGGTNAAARNIISGNGGFGVDVSGVSNVVEGNFIGVDATGSNGVGNLLGGVDVTAPSNTIGGLATGAGNIVSGNGADGIDVLADNNTLLGNFIGTDVSGSLVVSNALDGILVNGDFNIVGATNGISPNVISGNANGVRIDAQNNVADLNVIQGNRIGTDVNGTHILSNSLSGVLITEGLGTSASSNTVGGAAGAGNIIAGSGSNGVTIVGTNSTGDAILGNSIFSNALLGIDLGADGATPNHVGFLPGPNNFEDFPVLATTSCSNGAASVQGSVSNLAANGGVVVQFFANPACTPSGETFIGTTNLTADANGNVVFDVAFPGIDLDGQFITATATDDGLNTSEFSPCIEVVDTVPPVITQCATSLVASADINCQAAVPDFTTQVLATDNCTPSGSLIITQSPVSGTLLGLGTTNVTITVADSSGNSTNCPGVTFTVVDTTPPTIAATTSIVVTGAVGSVSNPVTYAIPTATDNCSTNVTVVCTPVSGSLFPFGTNSILCTATDGAGNIASNSFDVTVLHPLADLTGFWVATTTFSLDQYNFMFGAFRVLNNGPLAAPRSVLRFYRSLSASTNNGVLLPKKFTIRPLRAGQTNAPVIFGVKLPKGISGTNQFLIAVVNANNTVPESSDQNDLVSTEPTNFIPHTAALAHFYQEVHQATKGH